MAGNVYTMEELQNMIAPIAKAHGISKVYLFGSYGRGLATDKSDIDLLIDAPAIKNLFQLGGLYADLEDALGKKVDVITTRALAHPLNKESMASFVQHIREDERLIYEEQ